uniref:ATP synthase complex subunit 8 n=1 Tax=Sialis fuliginosa TaxID=1230162 RepID=A0A7D7AFL1_9NEOP|nr:ATP synthase F0 subunit 8 [Sialis fuliginosa]
MPQMAPLYWLMLFMFFLLTFILFNILNYFNFLPLYPNKSLYSSKKMNSLIWKW